MPWSERLASCDAIWLQDSEANPMMINVVMILDRLDPAALKAAFRARILEGGEACRFERLRCRVVERGGRRYWERDPAFDLDRHILAVRNRVPRGMEALQAHVGREAARGLDGSHPRWEVQVIDFEPGATALLVRIHHSIGDGEALVSLLYALVGEPQRRSEGLALRSVFPSLGDGVLASLARLAVVGLCAPGILLRRLAWFPDHSAMHGAALSGAKRVAWTRPLDLAVFKRARRVLGATVNDVLMASVSGAFSRYLAAGGGAAPERFLVFMPVNMRTSGKASRFDNRFAPVPLELPAVEGSHARRVQAVKARMDQLKRSPVPLVIYELQRALLGVLPRALSRPLLDFLANKCTAVVTNVNGPPRPLALEGRKVRSIMFWVPQRARIGIGISILSLAGKVQVGIIADEALVRDPRGLAEAFEAEFEELKAL